MIYNWIEDQSQRQALTEAAHSILKGSTHLCRRACLTPGPCQCRHALANYLLHTDKQHKRANNQPQQAPTQQRR